MKNKTKNKTKRQLNQEISDIVDHEYDATEAELNRAVYGKIGADGKPRETGGVVMTDDGTETLFTGGESNETLMKVKKSNKFSVKVLTAEQKLQVQAKIDAIVDSENEYTYEANGASDIVNDLAKSLSDGNVEFTIGKRKAKDGIRNI